MLAYSSSINSDLLDGVACEFDTLETTLSTKVHLVKAMVFPVVMYGCESWTVKKAEHRRIDAFEDRKSVV